MEKEFVSNRALTGLVGKICRQVINSGWKPDYIVGITRGGLVPAVMISHYFDVPLETLKISLRDGGECESNLWMAEDAFGYIPKDMQEGIDKRSDATYKKNILIVDDINDTGATINWLIEDWKSGCLPKDPAWDNVWNHNVRFATLFDNVASKAVVAMDYVGEEIDKMERDVWIDFPFESWWER